MGFRFAQANAVDDHLSGPDQLHQRWSLEDVSRSEYENMSGRAGRLSLVEDFGRSILVSSSPFEADVWLDQ